MTKRPNTKDKEIREAMEKIRQGNNLHRDRPWYKELSEAELRNAAKEYLRLCKIGYWPG